MYTIELETPTTANAAETMLLYGLAEELLIEKRWVDHYSRLSKDVVAIHVVATTKEEALMRTYNALRCSKNYMAHTCFVTLVD